MSTYTVTGAFGYSGGYITRRLLDAGHEVRTLTNSPDRHNPFGDRVSVFPYNFDDQDALRASLEGTEVLINTYWVRFDHEDFTHDQAVANSRVLFNAAEEAGVKRVVHVSITNPSIDSPLPYFNGKARLEEALADTGLPRSVLRPAVLFGGEDILVNNIAWALRRFPVFGIFGKGDYCIQPIHVEDLAALAVRESAEDGVRIVDAIGPETFTFRQMVEEIGRIIGKERRLMSIGPRFGRVFACVVGFFKNDVFLTRDEIEGLSAGLLCTDSKPAGTIKLTDWARERADTLGIKYASELARRRDRVGAYSEL